MAFFACFLSDAFYGLFSKTFDYEAGQITDERILGVDITLKVLTSILLVYFLVYEVKSALKQSDYLKDLWNIMDLSLIAIYLPVIILDLTAAQQDLLTIF